MEIDKTRAHTCAARPPRLQLRRASWQDTSRASNGALAPPCPARRFWPPRTAPAGADHRRSCPAGPPAHPCMQGLQVVSVGVHKQPQWAQRIGAAPSADPRTPACCTALAVQAVQAKRTLRPPAAAPRGSCTSPHPRGARRSGPGRRRPWRDRRPQSM